ncbi:MAG TPA: UDP-N-acetylglucosamine--N-acetylmuramyl-(pentapeptide) pyrophosphoryl-undecaprenol N-acetylglucosamine transferase [Treponemataceae bacterium]|nr:UDP-N-acetylglucosamine--N-acetylmuramyl-(pentapeptide) pyrophosphoryl-undecaprenol N-acetylglucosamine transferase [Treponemataceae bacterium]
MNYIAFTGGGTGGHIYPGLAVCDELKCILKKEGIENVNFLWIGNSEGMDKTIVEKSGSVGLFKGIPCGKLRRYFSIKNFIDVIKIISGFAAALSVLIRYKPLFLFSKGGFVSVPPCYAAKLLHIPVYSHECDFSPGLATRLNSRCAKKIFISYEQTKSCFSKDIQQKLIVTGNPVRKIFYNSDPELGRQFLYGNSVHKNMPVLFVLGGSSGALQINNLIRESFNWLCDHFFVVHQTGKNIGKELPLVHENYRSFEFIYNEMSHVLAACDVVLARSGANTLWEAAVQGKPMVLVPLSGAGTRGDQVENARLFKEQGAAEILLDEDVNPHTLQHVLTNMLDSETRKKYAVNAKNMTLGQNSAELIAHILFHELEERFCQ